MLAAAANSPPSHSWLDSNWFTLVQTIGIAGSLIFAALALRGDMKSRNVDAKARQVETLMLSTQFHRDIWAKILDKGSLNRILDSGADLNTSPVTEEERMLCTFLILHLFATFEAQQAGLFSVRWAEASDIGELFALPIPHAVWQMVKPYQNQEFVDYVDHAVVAATD